MWASPNGELFIADGRHGIREVKADGTITTIADGDGTYDIRGVTGDLDGALYATAQDPSYLLRVDPSDGDITKVVGTGTNGYNGTTDSNGVLLPGTSVELNEPTGPAVARNGDILFADSGDSLILAYVPSSGHVIVLAGAVSSDGKPRAGFNGDGKAANQTELLDPVSVAPTNGASVVITDAGNERVRESGPSPPSS